MQASKLKAFLRTLQNKIKELRHFAIKIQGASFDLNQIKHKNTIYSSIF